MEVQKLLVYFVKNAPKSLGRTEIMKYLYLFEYYYYQLYNKQYTGVKFERFHYGPNHASVIEDVAALGEMGIIAIETYENRYGNQSYKHYLVADEVSQYSLESREEEVASFVVDLLGKQDLRGVLDIAYSTPPMREILALEESQGKKELGRVIDMSKSEPTFKSTRQARLEARKRLNAKETVRGTDEEYYKNLLETYKDLEVSRRRAIIVEQ